MDPKPGSGGRPVDYEPPLLWAAADQSLSNVFAAAHQLVANQLLWYFTMDGFSRPFYGRAQRYGKKAVKRKAIEMTWAGHWGVGAFRSKGKGAKSGPMYRGTDNMHAYFQVNAHKYVTLETFPLGYRPFNPNAESMRQFIEQLDDAPSKPLMGFLDKEFGNRMKLADLRPWADKNGVRLLIPVRKPKKLIEFLVKRFNDGHAKPIPDVGRVEVSQGQVAFWDVTYQLWGQDPTAFYNLVTFYFEGDPRKSALIDPDSGVLGLGNNIYAASYYTNLEVTEENILALWVQTISYWSCENVQQRTKMYLGKASGARMFWRHLIHAAGLVHLGTYALWRLERMTRLKAEPDGPPSAATLKRRRSHRRYFGAVKHHLRDHFVPPDAPRIVW